MDLQVLQHTAFCFGSKTAGSEQPILVLFFQCWL